MVDGRTLKASHCHTGSCQKSLFVIAPAPDTSRGKGGGIDGAFLSKTTALELSQNVLWRP